MSNYKPTANYKLIYVYAINDSSHNGLLKIGKASMTSYKSENQLTPNCEELISAARHRINQQTQTAMVTYELLYTELAVKHIVFDDGTRFVQTFEDHDVHEVLFNSGYQAVKFGNSGIDSEWFKVDLETVKKAIKAVKDNMSIIVSPKVLSTSAAMKIRKEITLRKEQEENVVKTIEMFRTHDTMLWDCKMRYGKTVTAFELIRRQGYKKVIVITHRPAVEDGWESDHDLIFHGTDHVFTIKKADSTEIFDVANDSKNDKLLLDLASSNTPFTYFASIQDLRGSQRVGGKFNKNNAVFDMDWELIIVDEAHEGTQTELGDAVVTALKKKNTKLLSLSGTPYNLLGEYQENVYTWTYIDEQRAKNEWEELHPGEKNPYAELPTMNILTFDLSENLPYSYRYVTEDSAFNFREFFRVWTGDIKKDFRPIPTGSSVGDFVHEDDVRSFLDLITKESADSQYPFSNSEFRDMFRHTFWLVPGVKEAKALSKILRTHPIFSGFSIANIAGDGDAEQQYDVALKLVKKNIADHPYTITISCGKLTTGVTVREWTGIMMLSGSSSTAASGYMQAIFRVQSPGCINGKQKENCYVFDFAPDRALKVIADVHRITSKGGGETEKYALGEFLNFCPVIAVDGTVMRPYDVKDMMQQIKRISVENAVNSGFDDDSIYKSDTGIVMDEYDESIIKMLGDVLVPQKKGKKQHSIIINNQGLTEEEYHKSERIKNKPKRERTPEEKELLERAKKQKEEQRKIFDLLRAVSIRLPLLFYGADADITETIHLNQFVEIVDDESWKELMPKGLQKPLFLKMLKYYDEDVITGAGMRIRRMAKAADELPPTLRAARIVEIIGKFKNPDKETVLTPWRVVNMHMGDCIGGYNFFNEDYSAEIEIPRLVEQGEVTADILLNPTAKILELNSKSGLYPLYMAYSMYMIRVSGQEKDLPFEEAQEMWFETLRENIFVLCKTKMAKCITIRTLAGYTGKHVNVYCPPRLLDRLEDKERFSRKLTNPVTWERNGERMVFDAVVGNPPYQELVRDDSAARQLFPDFIKTAILINPKYVSLITPSRWFTGNVKTFVDFRSFIKENSHFVKIFDYHNEKEIFNNVSIMGGVNYFLYCGDHNGKVEYYNCSNNKRLSQSRNLFEDGLDIIIRNGMFAPIIEKVRSDNFESLSTITTSWDAFGISGSKAKLESMMSEEEFDGCVTVRCSRNEIRYISRDKLQKNTHLIDKWKVFSSRANGAAGMLNEDFAVTVTSPSYIGEPNVVCTEALLPFGAFETEKEAVNLKKYMESKFFRFMVGILKTSQDLYQIVYTFVPLQDFTCNSDIDWSEQTASIDKQLYRKYNLTDEEIAYIEKMVKMIE